MKNVMIVEPGTNCEYAIYSMTDEEFNTVFPGENQNVEFIEDLTSRLTEAGSYELLSKVWGRRVRKVDANGIHGTLFYQMPYKKMYYPNKNDEEMVVRGLPMSDWHDKSLG